jgi:hypothetical protein
VGSSFKLEGAQVIVFTASDAVFTIVFRIRLKFNVVVPIYDEGKTDILFPTTVAWVNGDFSCATVKSTQRGLKSELQTVSYDVPPSSIVRD